MRFSLPETMSTVLLISDREAKVFGYDYIYIGNLALFDSRKISFFASHSVKKPVLRWAETCCATDCVVYSAARSIWFL